MFTRVVRFTDVTAERVRDLEARISAADGPPPGVNGTGIQLLFDEDQATAVVLQAFASKEDMAAAEAVLDAMDPGDTPGDRVSVDRCEVRMER